MKKTFAKIAALVSAAVLCAVPMTTSMTANAKRIISPYYLGNVNGDDVLDMADAISIQMYYYNSGRLTATEKNYIRQYGDVNYDGVVDTYDASLIQHVCLKFNGEYENIERRTYIEHPMWGDANGDDHLDLSDAICIVQFARNREKYPTAGIFFMQSDTDRDGRITEADADTLQNYLLRL